ncbi:App1 family protein [Variovorax sp. J22R133]|uniref:phosphatidate phosphatase App1 family protein n=1 Tax=Variovorax brevis TaxID=3053503 RepID=UPI002578031F|nr:App1 family protein [Variovorax sp. J22R133]MDM0113472.1 App1 family protein [Variovorax sp. J22R133]
MSASREKSASGRPAGLRRRELVAFPLASLAALLPAANAQARPEPLEADEDILFLPGVARPLEDGLIDVDVHAWVYEKDRHWILDAGLARYMGVELGKLNPASRVRFAQRTFLFHAESEGGKAVEISFGHNMAPVTMPPSDWSGRTNLRATVPVAVDPRYAPWLRFSATVPGPRRRIDGRALLVPERGLSVISDIDDTIKRTQVRERREMMLNTFVRPFEPAPGMAAHYRAMARDPFTRFHYVSSSPIQLWPPLDAFLRHAGFPAGSVHLRESTTWRTIVPEEGESREHKSSAILNLFNTFPQRSFLLIGDSGELDPEIYGDIARAHGHRLQGIVIRDVTQEGRESPRYAAAFEGVDPVLWHVYADGGAWPVTPG